MSEEDLQTENNGTEKEARLFGWVSKDEFRGSETEWVDAEAFVKRGKEINPILRANNERLKKEMEAERNKHDREIKELKASAQEFKQFQTEALERKSRLLEVELQELKDQRKEAIREGDADLVVELEDRIEDVKEEKAKKVEVKASPVVEPTVQMDPNLEVWLGNNKWFGPDADSTDLANAVGASVRRQFPELKGKEFLEKLDEKLKQRMPELYSNQNQARSSVEGSSPRGQVSTGGKKSYDSLPADAKAACDKFVKSGLFKSKQEYVDLYDWS